MSKRWEHGSTRAWRNTRAVVILRDGGLCQIKLDGICLVYATEVHHKLGKGVSERIEDLEAACNPCNNKIGDPTTADPEPEPRTQW